MSSFFFVLSIIHSFLKAYLSFRGKIFKLYTFSCSPPTAPAIEIKKKTKKKKTPTSLAIEIKKNNKKTTFVCF